MLCRCLETISVLFKRSHDTHTPTHLSTRSLLYAQKGDVTRLDTHNQPAVIEAFKAWARTLTRAYAQFAVGFSRSSRA